MNNSQAVLNEINLAVGANVTIVPFRIAKVDFNSELNFYLGRMHWLDAFPQPVAAYIDDLIATFERNLEAVRRGRSDCHARRRCAQPPVPPISACPRYRLAACRPPPPSRGPSAGPDRWRGARRPSS